MGFFNFFTNSYDDQPKKKTEARSSRRNGSGSLNLSKKQSSGPDTFRPNSFEDLYDMIDVLRTNRSIIVDCTMLKEGTAVRVLDILSGATYALNGDWKPISNEIFMFTPNGSPENGKF